jgi:hypothetical protein
MSGRYLPAAWSILLLVTGAARAEAPPEPPPAPPPAPARANACVDGTSKELRGELFVATKEGGAIASADLKPGEKRTLRIFVKRGAATFAPQACATFQLGEGSPATIDGDVLAIDPKARHGLPVVVEAKIPGVARAVTGQFRVFDASVNPVAGMWHEVNALPCKGQKKPTLVDEVREFELRPNGNFSVTFRPFETYRDYWGHYAYDSKEGTIELSIEEGNFIPTDFQGRGRFTFDKDGNMRVDGLWLGAQAGMAKNHPNCGYVFRH